jgi:uncharacterized protein
MKCVLNKKPKKPTIILGFPGLGLVSTIATKYLLDHLKAEPIGHISIEEQSPLVAIHKRERVEPISLYYNKKYNFIILQSLTEVIGVEWKVAETIHKMAKDLNAKEMIILESTPTRNAQVNVMCYSTKEKSLKGIERLENAILMGVTAAMLLKANDIPVHCLFAEVHSNLPEHEAAAKIVEVLDKHLGISMDVKPLLAEARDFEEKMKTMLEQRKDMETKQHRPEKEKMQTYIG